MQNFINLCSEVLAVFCCVSVVITAVFQFSVSLLADVQCLLDLLAFLI